jgi:tripartite-type tricarboxylate transporter receptor subunit TctC
MRTAICRRTMIAAGLAAGTLAAPNLVRQAWTQRLRPEDRAARIVVPFAAGGTTDLVARIVAEILSRATGWNFATENRTGGNGDVGAELVARATPDGRTLLLGHIGTGVTNQYAHKYLSYDSMESFAPVAMVGELPNVLVVHPTFDCPSVAELVEQCRPQRACGMSYGSPAQGSMGHLAMEYLKGLADIRLAHMAYRGRSHLIKDLLAGHVPVAMDNLPAYLPHIRSGALRALAVSSARRWFSAPDIPTVAEYGFGDFNATIWWYVAAPAGTRRSLVRAMSDALVTGLACEPMVDKMHSIGVLETPRCAEELVEHMAAERVKWSKVFTAAGIEAR